MKENPYHTKVFIEFYSTDLNKSIEINSDIEKAKFLPKLYYRLLVALKTLLSPTCLNQSLPDNYLNKLN